MSCCFFRKLCTILVVVAIHIEIYAFVSGKYKLQTKRVPQSNIVRYGIVIQEYCDRLEWVQKNALQNILINRYISFFCFSFFLIQFSLRLYLIENSCCNILERQNIYFKRKRTSHQMKTRNPNKYEIVHANTETPRISNGPYIQRLLNKKEYEIIYVPVILDCIGLMLHCLVISL